jgi:hypothetical protein
LQLATQSIAGLVSIKPGDFHAIFEECKTQPCYTSVSFLSADGHCGAPCFFNSKFHHGNTRPEDGFSHLITTKDNDYLLAV